VESGTADSSCKQPLPGGFLEARMKKTILLVEDSKVQKLASERILHRAGYLVLFAENGEEALRLAGECVPDLVLLDLLLPGISGKEVLYDLKRNHKTQRIPVIVLSQLSADNSSKLQAAGAAAYFEKSRLADGAGQAALLATIDRVLRESEAALAASQKRPQHSDLGQLSRVVFRGK
jgi:two-component system, cell cycle response regulator DivK